MNIWFFFPSTCHVYKSKKTKIKESDKIQPISFYGRTKLLAENFLNKNKNSNIKDLYVEIQAMNKDKKIISVTNFVIKQAKINEIVNKTNKFSKIQSCSNIEDFNFIVG